MMKFTFALVSALLASQVVLADGWRCEAVNRIHQRFYAEAEHREHAEERAVHRCFEESAFERHTCHIVDCIRIP